MALMPDDRAEQTLFHFSEDGTIDLFHPRAPASDPDAEPSVWAIDAEHAVHYLLPRDCPRVTFAPARESSAEDIDRFLGPTMARRVVAVESGWLERIRRARLYRYHLPGEPFELLDRAAGYYLAREPVTPLRVEPIDDLLGELTSAGIELRILPSLWPLHDAVAASSLEFSMIRMRNAQPRATAHSNQEPRTVE